MTAARDEEPEQTLDAVVAERLVRLRLLLAGALAAATDQTPTGRHVSVVFLDGVTELALHLAADEVGINVTPRQGLEDIYAALANELGSAWDGKSWKGVRELHRARNNLQHHGILPDAQHLPLWAAEADRFVHSLVAVAFDADLTVVRAADAVADQGLREQLAQAEAAIDAGDFAGAVQRAKGALDAARARFGGVGATSRLSHNPFDEFRQIDRALGSLGEFVNVAYFATDPADWLWLQRIENLSRAQPVGRLDAERALSFAVGWILRFEAFQSRLPRREEVPPYVEPSLDEDYFQPQIVGAEVRHENDFRPTVEVVLTLDQTPPEWLDNLRSGIQEGQDIGEIPPGVWARRANGTVVMHVPEQTDASQIRALAEKIIQYTHLVYEAQRQARRDRRTAERALAERVRAALRDDPRVTEVRAEYWAKDRNPMIRLTIDDPDANHLNPYAVEEALNLRRPPGSNLHIGFRNGVFSFGEDQFQPGEALEVFDASVAEAKQRAAEQAREKEAAEAKHQQVLDAAKAAFADLAPPPPGGD
jgi:hypothetical protein